MTNMGTLALVCWILLFRSISVSFVSARNQQVSFVLSANCLPVIVTFSHFQMRIVTPIPTPLVPSCPLSKWIKDSLRRLDPS